MDAQIVVACVGGGFAVLVALISKIGSDNKKDHGEGSKGSSKGEKWERGVRRDLKLNYVFLDYLFFGVGTRCIPPLFLGKSIPLFKLVSKSFSTAYSLPLAHPTLGVT